MKKMMRGLPRFVREQVRSFFSKERLRLMGISAFLSILIAFNIVLGVIGWGLFKRNQTVESLRNYMYVVIDKDDRVMERLASEVKLYSAEEALNVIEMTKEFLAYKYGVQNMSEPVMNGKDIRIKMTLTMDKATLFSPHDFFDEVSKFSFPLIRIESLDYDVVSRIFVAHIEIIQPYGADE